MPFLLVINAGSSSVKFTLFDADAHEVAADGLVERIGLAETAVHFDVPGSDPRHPPGRRRGHARGR
jgi:acetate kinase